MRKAEKIMDGESYDPESERVFKNFTQYVVYGKLDYIISKTLDLIEGSETLSPEQVGNYK